MEIHLLEINCTYNILRIQKVTFFYLAQINDLNIRLPCNEEPSRRQSVNSLQNQQVQHGQKLRKCFGVKQTKEMKMNHILQR